MKQMDKLSYNLLVVQTPARVNLRVYPSCAGFFNAHIIL